MNENPQRKMSGWHCAFVVGAANPCGHVGVPSATLDAAKSTHTRARNSDPAPLQTPPASVRYSRHSNLTVHT